MAPPVQSSFRTEGRRRMPANRRLRNIFAGLVSAGGTGGSEVETMRGFPARATSLAVSRALLCSRYFFRRSLPMQAAASIVLHLVRKTSNVVQDQPLPHKKYAKDRAVDRTLKANRQSGLLRAVGLPWRSTRQSYSNSPQHTRIVRSRKGVLKRCKPNAKEEGSRVTAPE